MKNFSPALLSKLNEQYGSQPVLIVKINWPSGAIYYADRDYPGVVGRITEIAELSQSKQTTNSSEISAISLRIIDGAEHYLNEDLPNVIVDILQWYADISLASAGVIFRGNITSSEWADNIFFLTIESLTSNSSIVLKRTYDDRKIPIAFGNVLNAPAVKVRDSYIGTLAGPITQDNNAFRINDCTYEGNAQVIVEGSKYRIVYSGRVNSDGVFSVSTKNDILYTDVELTVSDNGYTHVTSSGIENMQKMFCLVPGQTEDLNDYVSVNYCQEHRYKYYSMNKEKPGIQSILKFETDWNFEKPNLEEGKISSYYQLAKPENTVYISAVAGAPKDSWGSYKRAVKWNYDPVQGELETYRAINMSTYKEHIPEVWAIEAGAKIAVVGRKAVFQASSQAHTILGVRAYRRRYGETFLADVPSRYFDLVTFDGSAAVQLKRPLDSYLGENWSDELFLTIRTGDRNTANQIKKIIQDNTTLGIDDVSFTDVAGRIPDYPSSFVIDSEADVLATVREIARQARCAVVLRAGVVSLVYLSYLPSNIGPMNFSNILERTLSFSHTDFDDVFTRSVTAWKVGYAKDDTRELVLTQNVARYGEITNEEDIYIYNNEINVKATQEFWLNRHAWPWRTATASVALSLLNLEIFDVVNLSTPYASGNSVVDTISQSIENWDLKIELTIANHLGTNAYDPSFFYVAPGSLDDPTSGVALVDYVPDQEYDEESLDADLIQRMDYSIKWGGPEEQDGNDGTDELGYIIHLEIPSVIMYGETFTLKFTLKKQDGTPYIPDVGSDNYRVIESTYGAPMPGDIPWIVNAQGIGRAQIRITEALYEDLPVDFQIRTKCRIENGVQTYAVSNTGTLQKPNYTVKVNVEGDNAEKLPSGSFKIPKDVQCTYILSMYINGELDTLFAGYAVLTYPENIFNQTINTRDFNAGEARDFAICTEDFEGVKNIKAIIYDVNDFIVIPEFDIPVTLEGDSSKMQLTLDPSSAREGQSFKCKLKIECNQALEELTFPLTTPFVNPNPLNVMEITVVKDPDAAGFVYTGEVTNVIEEGKVEVPTLIHDVYLDPVPTEVTNVNTTTLFIKKSYDSEFSNIVIKCNGLVDGEETEAQATFKLLFAGENTAEIKIEPVLLISRCNVESTTGFDGQNVVNPYVNPYGTNGKDIG